MVWGTIIEAMTRCKLCNCRQLENIRHHLCYSTEQFWRLFQNKTCWKKLRNSHVAWRQVFTYICIKSEHLLFFVAIVMSGIFILCHRILLRNIFCAHVCTFSRGRKIFMWWSSMSYFSAPNLEYLHIRYREILIVNWFLARSCFSACYFIFIFWFCFWYCFKYSCHRWRGHDWMNIICPIFCKGSNPYRICWTRKT